VLSESEDEAALEKKANSLFGFQVIDSKTRAELIAKQKEESED